MSLSYDDVGKCYWKPPHFEWSQNDDFDAVIFAQVELFLEDAMNPKFQL